MNPGSGENAGAGAGRVAAPGAMKDMAGPLAWPGPPAAVADPPVLPLQPFERIRGDTSSVQAAVARVQALSDAFAN